MLAVEMAVEVGGRDRLVPDELPDRLKLHTALAQANDGRMPQGMSVKPWRETRAGCPPFGIRPDRAVRDASTLARQEQSCLMALPSYWPNGQPSGHGVGCGDEQGDGAPLASLAEADHELLVGESDVLDVEHTGLIRSESLQG